jgi:hypothetical protein
VDIAVALGIALLVNVAVLLVAAATFHQAGTGQALVMVWLVWRRVQLGRLLAAVWKTAPTPLPPAMQHPES